MKAIGFDDVSVCQIMARRRDAELTKPEKKSSAEVCRKEKHLAFKRGNHSAEMESFGDFQVTELNRRASGQAFQVILSPPSSGAIGEIPLSPLKKKETSLDDIKKKLEAADERRKSQGAEAQKQFAEKREHEKEVVQKAIEENYNFRKMTEEKINQKMEAYKEKHSAQMVALTEKFKAKDKKLEEVKKKCRQ